MMAGNQKPMIISDHFTRWATERPNFPVMELDNNSVSYGQLRDLSENIAGQLRLRGFQPGDIIGLRLDDYYKYCALMWATALCGCVIFPMRTAAPRSEMRTAAVGIPLKAVVIDSSRLAVPGFENIAIDKLVAPLDASDQTASWPKISPSAPFKMCQTSGSTGKPKTFVFSHSQVINISRQYGSEMYWSQGDRLFFGHEASDTWGSEMLISALYAGATIVLCSQESTADHIAYMQKRRITLCGMGPHRIRQLLEHAGDKLNQFPYMKFLEASTSVLFPEERELFHRHYTRNVYNTYGTTEMPFISMSRPEDLDLHPDSVGQLYPGVEVEIVDDNHKPVPVGVTGLLRARSDNMLTGYYQDPEATLKHFRDGWFYPLDHAHMNDDGYLFLQGRTDDIINLRGAKFYPAEIEKVLMMRPRIREAVVLGWPDKTGGEIAVAVVSAFSPVRPDRIRAHCSKFLAANKIPAYIFCVNSIPKTATGKVDVPLLKKIVKTKMGDRTTTPSLS